MGRVEELLEEHRAASSRLGSSFQVEGLDLGRLAEFASCLLQRQDRGAPLELVTPPPGARRLLARYLFLGALADRLERPSFLLSLLGEQRERFADRRRELAQALMADDPAWRRYIGRLIRSDDDESSDWPTLTPEEYQREADRMAGLAGLASGQIVDGRTEDDPTASLVEIERLRDYDGWVYRDDQDVERVVDFPELRKAVAANALSNVVVAGHVDWMIARLARPRAGRGVEGILFQAISRRLNGFAKAHVASSSKGDDAGA